MACVRVWDAGQSALVCPLFVFIDGDWLPSRFLLVYTDYDKASDTC